MRAGKKRHFLCWVLAAATALSLFSACGRAETSARKTELSVGGTEAYRTVRTFVLGRMTGADGGVHTNALPAVSSGDETRGYDVLAESQGFLMAYAVKTGDEALFRKAWQYVREHMILKSGLVAWRVVNGSPADSDATVDDLRICEALRNAAARFHRTAYRTAAGRIADALYQNCRQGSLLLSGAASSSTPVLVSYLDLSAVEANAEADARWKPLAASSRSLLEKARLKTALPLFRQTYLPSSRSFSSQESYDTVSSLLAFYYESETGLSSARADGALKSACDSDGLFAAYQADGTAASDTQSSAIYALTMLAAREENDSALYRSAEKKLMAFRVTDSESVLCGGFGDAATGKAYSFDNLLALLALVPTSSEKG